MRMLVPKIVGSVKNQGCHMYELPSLRGEPLRVAVTEIVRGEILIHFL
jgi:hypothetical protein